MLHNVEQYQTKCYTKIEQQTWTLLLEVQLCLNVKSQYTILCIHKNQQNHLNPKIEEIQAKALWKQFSEDFRNPMALYFKTVFNTV